jgi:hypothetical protein
MQSRRQKQNPLTESFLVPGSHRRPEKRKWRCFLETIFSKRFKIVYVHVIGKYRERRETQNVLLRTRGQRLSQHLPATRCEILDETIGR